MKRFLSLIGIILCASTLLFAAGAKKVAESKLVQTLEKNKKDGAEFSSEISLAGLKIGADGSVTLPLFAGARFGSRRGLTRRISRSGLLMQKKARSP